MDESQSAQSISFGSEFSDKSSAVSEIDQTGDLVEITHL
jgi:hypothetical protein